jgi:A/G-specific adenine glycosylase
MVDSNFVRLMRRTHHGHWMSDYRWDARMQAIATAVIAASQNPRHANWAVLDLGSMVCRPRDPRCGECPIASVCLTGSGVQGAVATAAQISRSCASGTSAPVAVRVLNPAV